MSSPKAPSILHEALEREKGYEWSQAAEKYAALLSQVAPSSEEAANASMRIGYCYEQAAYQSLSASEFEHFVDAGVEAFRTAEALVTFEASETQHMIAKARRLRLQSIMSAEHEERVLLLDDAIGVQRVVLQKLDPTTGEAYFEQVNYHLQLIYERSLLHGDERITPLLTEGLDLIERLTSTKKLPSDANLAGEMYLKWVWLALGAYFAMEGWAREEGRVKRIAVEAASIAPTITDHLTLSRLHSSVANVSALFGESLGTTLQQHLDLALSEAQKTDNGTEIGVALSGLAFSTRWKLVAEKNEEPARELFETVKLYYEEGRRRLRHLSDPVSRYFLLNLYGDMVQSYFVFATGFITDQPLRRRTIEEGISIFREAYQLGEGEFNDNLPYLWYAGAEALQQLALIEEDAGKRKAILNEAVELDRRATEIALRTSPHFSWNLGIQMISEATMRSLLAKDILDESEKRGLLEDAAKEFREGFSKIATVVQPLTDGQVLRMGNSAFRFAKVLQDLYELSSERALLEDELKVLDEATKEFDRIGRSTRVAEALWLKASVKDLMGKPQEAAREYARASAAYSGSVSESPSLRTLYEELSQYMLAWQHIEQARFAHSAGRFAPAAEAYRRASDILSKVQRWSPLGLHYSACGVLEDGEQFSRSEEPDAAAKLFAKAAEGFAAAAVALEKWGSSLPSLEEQSEASGWLALSVSRERYSLAMANLEEAKLLDRRGERLESAQGFESAAELLEQLAKSGGDGEWREETITLALLCRAWQLLKQAETQEKPERYASAAKLFEDVSGSSRDDKLVAMARGNAAFCHALEAGAGLRVNRDPSLFRVAKQQLEAATDYYTEAGMERAASWTTATERMFDGSVYLTEAEGELATNEKARLYSLAESSFESAARLYAKAGYTGKQQEAERHLEQVKQRKSVFASPAEALDAGIVLQMPEKAPSLTRDQSVGYEWLQHANIQCNMTLSKEEAAAGEAVQLELEMVNAGNAPALMVKVDGFPPAADVESVSPGVVWEIDHLVFKARKIEPMATEEIRLKVIPWEAGVMEIAPKFLYLDEGGKYRGYTPEAVILTVTGGVSRADKRGLSAIVFTDVVGYTALTQKNEALTLELLKEHERLVRETLPKHNGREVKTIGDSFLIEFASALEATSFAIDIQKATYEKNLGAKAERRIELRVGVHVGDVVHRGGDVLGDVVNIASRIRPLAEAGGICVSQQVYDQVWNKLECKFLELRKQELKNVQAPIGVYRIVLPWESQGASLPSPPAHTDGPLPGSPGFR
ncbi:MAG: adenylate/guanylate cyclase domain-containing protein [Conexivisphaerales archaeon]